MGVEARRDLPHEDPQDQELSKVASMPSTFSWTSILRGMAK